MSFSFSSLVRMIVLLALGSVAMAVGVSRLDPPRAARRTRQPATLVGMNEYFLNASSRDPRWLDVDTGRVASVPLADGDLLESPACSPWVDEKGHRQVVGRWSSRTEDGPMAMSVEFGLARYTFPGGEVIDKVPTEIVPTGTPCFVPGTRARVIFPAGDGVLYRFAFEPEPGTSPTDARDRPDLRPRPLRWRCPRPGVGEVYLADLSWPEDPRLDGCLLVTLRQQDDRDGVRVYSRSRSWWLKLDHAGTEIVNAGPLIVPGTSTVDLAEFDDRAPTIATRPDGEMALAFLRQKRGDPGWSLRLAPVRTDGERHVPTVHDSEARIIERRCQPAPPAFSADGRWINALAGESPTRNRVLRFPTGETLAAEAGR